MSKSHHYDKRHIVKHREKNCECVSCYREIWSLSPIQTQEEIQQSYCFEEREVKRAKKKAKSDVKKGKQHSIKTFFTTTTDDTFGNNNDDTSISNNIPDEIDIESNSNSDNSSAFFSSNLTSSHLTIVNKQQTTLTIQQHNYKPTLVSTGTQTYKPTLVSTGTQTYIPTLVSTGMQTGWPSLSPYIDLCNDQHTEHLSKGISPASFLTRYGTIPQKKKTADQKRKASTTTSPKQKQKRNDIW